jgi:hypothetical protein
VRDEHVIARRQYLTGMLAAFALASAGLFMGSRAQNAPNKLVTAHSALVTLLENPRDAYAIGLAYLRILSPDERSADYLVKETLTSVSLATRTPRGLRMIGRLVNQRMRRDFAEGAVVAVDRWILSVTEARLYALAALHE